MARDENRNRTDANDVDREIRINELREEARELCGGEMHYGQMAECPPEIEEQFWRSVVSWEKAEWTTNFEQLSRQGVELPPPDRLSETHLPEKLREVIFALAEQQVYLMHTNHLQDRDLYRRLYDDILRDEVKDVPLDCQASQFVDLLGSGSDEDLRLLATYYDEVDWGGADCSKHTPPSEPSTPPSNRDGWLPKAEGF